MSRARAVLCFTIAAALLAGCPEKREDPCSNESLKQSVLGLAADWYLFPELLPAVDPAAYASPAELLDALTADARAAGKDRYWSYVTTVAAQQSFFVEGKTVGFGIGLLVRETSRLFVSQVFPGSAADPGFLRGDEILAVGETADTLVPVATLLATTDGLSAALGPPTAGITRTFQVTPRAGGQPVLRTMTKAIFGLDPVPQPQGQVFDLTGTGGPKVGYVALRTFIAPAEVPLRDAFTRFQAAGVTDVIVDLRYNGGGLLSTAELLANLLGANLRDSVMFRLQYNARHADRDFVDLFAPEPMSLAPVRVAFLVTEGSASASELVPNVLEPSRAQDTLALVGQQSYGKPVGQAGFRHSQCDLLVYLVSFRLSNAQGDGDYFGGLPAPGFSGCAIAAQDDLLHDLGDPSELQTAAALDWITTGSCPTAPLSPLAAAPSDAYPEPQRPSEAQRHVRGLF